MYKFLLFFLFTLSLSYAKENTLNVAIAAVDKDSDIEPRHFEADFKAKYKDKSFIYEYKAPEKTASEKFKEAIAEFLNDLFGSTSKSISGKTVETILKIIAGLIILFVIYLIVKAIMNREGKWIFGRSNNKKIIDYNDIEQNIHIVNFQQLIQEALSQGNKRLAIRYYYLWLLKKMTDKNIIEWDIEKTNSDYSYEIRNEKLKEDFSYLSYLYNYIWYGEFELTDDAFDKTKKAFETTFQSLVK